VLLATFEEQFLIVGNTVFAVNPAFGSSWSAIDCGRRK
jgi:hypothetical protein